MPKRVQLKEAADAGAENGHSANGTTAAAAVMVPPPPASSEARGDAPWSSVPGDAPPSLYVARRVRAIAAGEEWPPADASPAWLAGRESALAGDPVEFNPHAREEDTSGEEQQMAAEWNDGWQCGTAEANATASNEPTAPEPAAEARGPKQHPEGKWELYQGIPGKDDFSDADQEYLDAPALSRMGGELIERCEEFKHLRGLDIRYFWKARGGAPNNKVRLGRSYQPDGLEQGQLRQVLNLATNLVCDYDERRPKHSRCGVRFLAPEYGWLKPGSVVEGDVTYCEACSRRTALEAAGTKVQPCTSCGALMYWGVGARGGRVPLSVRTGVSHFADCPNAAKHSKKGSR